MWKEKKEEREQKERRRGCDATNLSSSSALLDTGEEKQTGEPSTKEMLL